MSSYSSNAQPETNTNDKGKKKAPTNRESRRMCNSLFCPENECTLSFDSILELKKHLDNGDQSSVAKSSSVD